MPLFSLVRPLLHNDFAALAAAAAAIAGVFRTFTRCGKGRDALRIFYGKAVNFFGSNVVEVDV